MKTIIAATKNKHKIKEIEAITLDFDMNIISRNEAGVPNVEVEETGTTFEENSYIKSYEIMKLSGQITIADDSGLVVDCLGGAPGVYSARFSEFKGVFPDKENEDTADSEPLERHTVCDSGTDVNGFDYTDDIDSNNNAKLRRLIKDVPYEKRTARFVSVITMVYPDGRYIVARGEVEGHLILEERGEHGFGYDPMFVPLGYDKTFGELDSKIKNGISHRANALKVLREKLATGETDRAL